MGPDPKKLAALEEQMKALNIRAEDIDMQFVKSSGRGGQKVNKTSSAVVLRHRPTRLVVKCSKHRSQHLNRFLALRSLVEKIEGLKNGVPDAHKEKLARIRKQKQRRKKKAKTKVSPKQASSQGNVAMARD